MNRDETHGNRSTIKGLPGTTALKKWIHSAFRPAQDEVIRMMHIQFNPATGSMLLNGSDW